MQVILDGKGFVCNIFMICICLILLNRIIINCRRNGMNFFFKSLITKILRSVLQNYKIKISVLLSNKNKTEGPSVLQLAATDKA